MMLADDGGRVTVGGGGRRAVAACGASKLGGACTSSATQRRKKPHCGPSFDVASARCTPRRWRRVRRAGGRGAKRARPTGPPRSGRRRASPRARRAIQHARRRARRVVAHGGGGGSSRSQGDLCLCIFHSCSVASLPAPLLWALPGCTLAPASPCAGARFDSACSAPPRARLCRARWSRVGWRSVRTPAKRLKGFRGGGDMRGGRRRLCVGAGARGGGVGAHALGDPRVPAAREVAHKGGAIHGGRQAAGGVAREAARAENLGWAQPLEAAGLHGACQPLWHEGWLSSK